MPWCARCGTGISQHEIVTDGYQEVTHESVFVRFPIANKPGLANQEKEALLGLDDNALDAHQQCCRRRWPGIDLCQGAS